MIKKDYLEKKAFSENSLLCGIDEAGRGSLFGPLVVAAAILKKKSVPEYIKDSKQTTELQRVKSYKWIKKNCITTTVIVDSEHIDRLNIYKSTQLAMKKAFLQLEQIVYPKKIEYVITDSVPIKIDCPNFFNPNKAESISSTVAAASIVAKLKRDSIVKKLSRLFPNFDLEKHKGYGTKSHTEKILSFGPSLIHRKTFISGIKEEINDRKKQQAIF